jgi:hypothetical protein
MAVKAGSFQIATGAIGTEYGVTGLAFRPAGVFFRWSGFSGTDTGPTEGSTLAGYGFVLENGKRGCVAWWGQNGADPYQAHSSLWNTEAIVRASSATAGRADFLSMNDDGFTLVIDEVFGIETTVFYLAISGVEFNAIEITEPGATGQVSYADAGFRPTFVNVLGSHATAFDTITQDASYCVGASSGASADTNAVSAKFADSSLGFSALASYDTDTECLAIIESGPIVSVRASLVAFGSDGITLDWLERNGSRRFIAVVASGRWNVGNVTMPTDTNPFTETGMTWTPEGLAIFGGGRPKAAQDTPEAAFHKFSVGFGTGPTERFVCQTMDNSGTVNSRISTYHQSDAIYANVATGGSWPTIIGQGDINSAFAADTIELVMDTAETLASFAWYFVFGPPIIAFRQRLVRYQHNTYSSRAAGRTIVRDVLGRTVSGWELRPDNWLFSGGPGFVTPKKFASLLVNPSTFYMETVQPSEGSAKIETNREALFVSLMRRLAG